jgi:hypothetical protein
MVYSELSSKAKIKTNKQTTYFEASTLLLVNVQHGLSKQTTAKQAWLTA